MICESCKTEQPNDSKFCMNCGTSLFINNARYKMSFKERQRRRLREQFNPLFEKILDIVSHDKELVDYKIEKIKEETVDGSPGHFVRLSFHSKNSFLITVSR